MIDEKTKEERRAKLRALTVMSLDEKEAHAAEQIEQFYMREKGQVYLAFSGGKDSTVVKYIMEHKAFVQRDIPAVFVNTGLEYPESVEFAKEQGAVALRPEKTFKQVLIEYGYPLISKDVASAIAEIRHNPTGCRQKQFDESYSWSKYCKVKWKPMIDLPIKISNKCCEALKKSPLKNYQRKTGRHSIRGLTVAEGGQRRQSWMNRGGCTAFSDEGSKAPVCDPISPWLSQDVLKYIVRENIAISSVYGTVDKDRHGRYACSGESRTGCMFCPFGMHLEKGETRFQRLQKLRPKIYEYVVGGGRMGRRKRKGNMAAKLKRARLCEGVRHGK